jgi:hypothetical protein
MAEKKGRDWSDVESKRLRKSRTFTMTDAEFSELRRLADRRGESMTKTIIALVRQANEDRA